jgi:hypothetical protein
LQSTGTAMKMLVRTGKRETKSYVDLAGDEFASEIVGRAVVVS